MTLLSSKNNTKRKKQIYEYIVMVNILSLFVVMVAFIIGGKSFKEGLYTYINIKDVFLLGSGLLAFFLITNYFSEMWQKEQKEFVARFDILYILLFFIGSILILFLVGDKFYNAEIVLFLPIIIGASIWGKRFGLLLATICAFILLVYSFRGSPYNEMGLILGKNTIGISIMYIGGWFIGAVADLESNYRQSLTIIANTDSLTGLYKQRFFQEKLAECFEKATLKEPLSLVILDIDDFKYYNDSFGHLAGNQVLKKISNILKESLKERGYLARYGGEEFVLLLPNCCSKEAEIGRAHV